MQLLHIECIWWINTEINFFRITFLGFLVHLQGGFLSYEAGIASSGGIPKGQGHSI